MMAAMKAYKMTATFSFWAEDFDAATKAMEDVIRVERTREHFANPHMRVVVAKSEAAQQRYFGDRPQEIQGGSLTGEVAFEEEEHA